MNDDIQDAETWFEDNQDALMGICAPDNWFESSMTNTFDYDIDPHTGTTAWMNYRMKSIVDESKINRKELENLLDDSDYSLDEVGVMDNDPYCLQIRINVTIIDPRGQW